MYFYLLMNEDLIIIIIIIIIIICKLRLRLRLLMILVNSIQSYSRFYKISTLYIVR